MIHNFSLCPEELFYSAIAWWKYVMRFPSLSVLRYKISGMRTFSTNFALPSHLQYFVDHLGPQYSLTVEHIIQYHTLYPYVKLFLLPKRAEHMKQEMYNRSLDSHRTSGMIAGSLPDWPSFLRLCPCCVVEDRKIYRRAYFHRVHQLQGVLVCPKHNVFLEKTNIPTYPRHYDEHYISAEHILLNSRPQKLNLNDRNDIVLLKIATESQWILEQNDLSFSTATLQKQYRVALYNLGFGAITGTFIHWQKLYDAIRDRYSDDLLESLDCTFAQLKRWLARLITNPDIPTSPLPHLLLTDFLGYSLKTLYTIPDDNLLFGPGPWPCLNPFCDNYRKKVITDCKITNYHQQVRADFTCACGFSYLRYGPDHSPKDQFTGSHAGVVLRLRRAQIRAL
jgi:hypothetical protein